MSKHVEGRAILRHFGLGVSVMATAVLLAGSVGTARAATVDRGFSAFSQSSGFYVTYGIPGFLIVDDYIDGGGPISQATAGSNAPSAAFASVPYPGATFAGYPGLIAAASGSAPPGYPLLASARYPTEPEQTVTDPSGSIALAAKAKEAGSAGSARTAPGGSVVGSAARVLRSETNSEVSIDAGKIVSTASSISEGLVVGSLTVGAIRSDSVTTYVSGSERAASSTQLLIEGGHVNDLSFTFGPGGLHVARQGVPIPAGQGVEALNQALAPSGVSLGFADPSATEDGATAGAFEVTHVADMPGAGKGALRLTFGRARSSIALGEPASADTETATETVTEPATGGGPGGAAPGAPASASPAMASDRSATRTAHVTAAGLRSGGSGASGSDAGGDSDDVAAVETLPIARLQAAGDDQFRAPAVAALQAAGDDQFRAPAVAALLSVAVLVTAGLLGGWLLYGRPHERAS